MMKDHDIGPYEGLIHSTAGRYAPYLDEDFEDIQQILRLKVWQALRAFDPSRTKLPVQNYVFACMRNRVKDLLKGQDRRNKARGGSQLHIEDVAGDQAAVHAFEARYLAQSREETYSDVEDERMPLPATLTPLEVSVVQLLLLDFNQTEIAGHLKVSRQRVRAAHQEIQTKMADWRPEASAPVASLLEALQSREADASRGPQRVAQAA